MYLHCKHPHANAGWDPQHRAQISTPHEEEGNFFSKIFADVFDGLLVCVHVTCHVLHVSTYFKINALRLYAAFLLSSASACRSDPSCLPCLASPPDLYHALPEKRTGAGSTGCDWSTQRLAQAGWAKTLPTRAPQGRYLA